MANKLTNPIRAMMNTVMRVIRFSPMIIVAPLLTFAILASVGTWAVYKSADQIDAANLMHVAAIAHSSALSIELSLFVALQPAKVMASFVREFPVWPTLITRFDRIAAQVLAQASQTVQDTFITYIRLLPFGWASVALPPSDPFWRLDGNVSVFQQTFSRADALRTVYLNSTTFSYVAIPAQVPKITVRVPIFIVANQSDLFGQQTDSSMREFCTPCYRPDLSEKFWGFTTADLMMWPFLNRTHTALVNLDSFGYVYVLMRSATVTSYTPDILIIESDDGASANIAHMLMATIQLPNSQWFLFISPGAGWRVSWTSGVASATIIISFLGSSLLLSVLISRRQYELLLLSLIPAALVERVWRDKAFTRESCEQVLMTPAEKILDIMTQLLRGISPSLQDVIFIRTAMLQSFDLYAPIGIEERIQDVVTDVDVGASLMALVGQSRRAHHPRVSKTSALSGHMLSIAEMEDTRRILAAIIGGGASPVPALIEQVERFLFSAFSWDFDVFQLSEATHGKPLSALAFFLFAQTGLIKSFNMPTGPLIRYLIAIEEGYSNDNQYHNRLHAADVLQSMHLILHEGGMMATSNIPGYVDEVSLLACYLAATVHDFEHGGHTNEFLIVCGDTLAMTYNDKSPLENHHLSAACKLLQLPEMNFILNLGMSDGMRMRRMLIDLILATDMKQHFAINSQFSSLHRLNTASVDDTLESVYCSNDKPDALQLPLHHPVKVPVDETERILSLQMALKLADLGHLSAPLPVHLRWVAALEEEFFRQGDAEKTKLLPVSPLFDRTKPGITRSQVGFFDVVLLPCVTQFVIVFQGCKPMLKGVRTNYDHWKCVDAEREVIRTESLEIQ